MTNMVKITLEKNLFNMAKIMINGNSFAKLIFIQHVNVVRLFLNFACQSINIFYILMVFLLTIFPTIMQFAPSFLYDLKTSCTSFSGKVQN